MSYKDYNFKKIRNEIIAERNIDATLYEHVPTGARLMTLDNDDDNKVFALSFRTPVFNNYGLPHILEHSVFQGSEKYPLNDPFGHIIKSSLYTYLNASTYPDKTLYPVASTNTKDFFNLAGIYCDAALCPLLRDEDLDREGWHYEIDPDTNKLIYKGVVYNEMWGAMANVYREIFDKASAAIFPDTTYFYNSGGNPHEIPSITHDIIRQFHKDYYHPTNCYAFFYGNDRSDERFRLLDEYFNKFDKKTIDSRIRTQSLESLPDKVSLPLINYSDETKGVTLSSYVFGDTGNMEDLYDRYIEAYYLLGTTGSPLYKALQDSELGDEVFIASPQMGYPGFDEIAQKWALFGLKNVSINDMDAVHDLIRNTILQTIGTFDPRNLESSLSTIEFNLKEYDTGSTPPGLSMIDEIMTYWLYDGDPFEALRYEQRLASIKRYMDDSELFLKNLKTYWLDYHHQTRIDFVPDNQAKENWKQKPLDTLKQIQDSLSNDQIDAIKNKQIELQQQQEKAEDPDIVDLLPSLAISDLEKENEYIPREIITKKGTEIVYHDQQTNGIIYCSVYISIDHLDDKELAHLPLLCQMLFESGTSKRSLSELQFDIGTYTGGLSVNPTTTTTLDGKVLSNLKISLRCLPQYATICVELIEDILFHANLNNRAVLKQLISQNKSSYYDSITGNSFGYALSSIEKSLTPEGALSDIISGLDQFEFISSLKESDNEVLDGLSNRLISLRNIAFTQTQIKINVTTDKDSKGVAMNLVDGVVASIPQPVTNPHPIVRTHTLSYDNIAMTIPGKVNFAGVGFLMDKGAYTHTGSMAAVTKYLMRDFLWQKIRLIGGAYHTHNSYDNATGLFALCSYRDPNISKTLSTYLTIGEHLKNMNISKDQVDRLIIGSIKGFNTGHLLPHQKGGVSFGRYLNGVSDEYLQTRRSELLATNSKDFKRIGESISTSILQNSQRIIGNKDQINEELSSSDYKIVTLVK